MYLLQRCRHDISLSKQLIRGNLIAHSYLKSALRSSTAKFSGNHDHSEEKSLAEEFAYQKAILIVNQYQTCFSQKNETTLSPTHRTRWWLRLLDLEVDELQKPRVIHIAGSKGKGTTCYYCNHILNEYRKLTGHPTKIGCYTSPHQVDIRERFLINDQKISKQLFSFYVVKLHGRIQYLSGRHDLETPPIPGYPGFLALLGIYILLKEGVDVAILETGIGGERDSTNIFPRPIATGITAISLDHVVTLGNTVEKIAWHKGGIFKAGSKAFAVDQNDAILEVLRQRALEKNVLGGLQIVTDQNCTPISVIPNRRYQRLNANLATELCKTYLKDNFGHVFDINHMVRDLRRVALPGRCEVFVKGRNTWYISIAHNLSSLEETVAWYITATQTSELPRVLIFNQGFSVSSPRDPYPLLKAIYDRMYVKEMIKFNCVIFCTNQSDETGKENSDLTDHRANSKPIYNLASQNKNMEIWHALGGSGKVAIVRTIKDAILLVEKNHRGASILATGSSILVGRLLQILH